MRCNRSCAKVPERRPSLVTFNRQFWGEREPVADFLDEKRKEIQARLKELQPLVEEFHRLEAAEQALSGVGGAPAAAAPTPRRRRSSSASSNGRRGRPRGSGTRAAQALQLVGERPGI